MNEFDFLAETKTEITNLLSGLNSKSKPKLEFAIGFPRASKKARKGSKNLKF